MKTDLPQKLNTQLVAKNLDLSKFSRGETADQKKELTAYFSSLVSIGIAEKIGENLFKATANPDTLMKVGKGVGSAVMGDKGIVKQSEFVKHGFYGITPMLLFQSMSVITGQYYLHNINQNLKSLVTQVDRLISYNKDKDLSKLKVAFNMVEELFLKSIYDNHEYGLVLNKTKEIEELSEFCNIKISSTRNELNFLYKKFKNDDYHLQCEDITQNRPWYDILTPDIISELNIELSSKISSEKRMKRYYIRESKKSPEEAKLYCEEKIIEIEREYRGKIHHLEKTFRDVEDVRNFKTISKRKKELAKLLESTELFYYVELKTMIDFILVQLKVLKLKILLTLEKNDKNIYEMENLYSLISDNSLSEFFTPQNKFITNFEHKILSFLNSSSQKFEGPVYNRFTEIKNVFSQIQTNVKKQEDLQKNSELYFTLKDDESSYIILNK